MQRIETQLHAVPRRVGTGTGCSISAPGSTAPHRFRQNFKTQSQIAQSSGSQNLLYLQCTQRDLASLRRSLFEVVRVDSQGGGNTCDRGAHQKVNTQGGCFEPHPIRTRGSHPRPPREHTGMLTLSRCEPACIWFQLHTAVLGVGVVVKAGEGGKM